MAILSPSILSADFANLKRDIDAALRAGADMIHVDVMDGHFVPNISIGVPVVKSLKKADCGFLDVHLMITQPWKYISSFLDSGADLLTIHIEAEGDMAAMIEKIHCRGRKAALAIKPGTPVEVLFPFLDKLDMALIMSVEPGFSGQLFMDTSLNKISALRSEITRRKLKTSIEVDGGINHTNAREILTAGADILVAGSSVFGAENIGRAVSDFKGF